MDEPLGALDEIVREPPQNDKTVALWARTGKDHRVRHPSMSRSGPNLSTKDHRDEPAARAG